MNQNTIVYDKIKIYTCCMCNFSSEYRPNFHLIKDVNKLFCKQNKCAYIYRKNNKKSKLLDLIENIKENIKDIDYINIMNEIKKL